MHQIPKKQSFLLKPFIPPFPGLIWVIWTFFICTFMVHPYSPILKGHFMDPDDLVHGLRFIDLMNGQSWFDPIIYRLAPPEGVISHFSRLAELPYILFAIPAHAFGLTWVGSMMVTGALYPSLLFLCFLFVLRAVSRLMVGKSWATASAFVALFSHALLFQYSPGRIDHHGLAMILVLASILYVIRCLRRPRLASPAIIAGSLLGLCQAIALETLPWILVLSAWVGFWMVFDGKRRAKSGFLFSLSFYLISALCLFLTQDAASFFTMDAARYSFLYVILAAAIAFVFVVNSVAGSVLPRIGRFSFALASSVTVAWGFLSSFPELWAGPYGSVDTQILAYLTNYIDEARPVLTNVKSMTPGVFFLYGYFFLCTYAAISTTWKLRHSRKRRDWLLWFVLLVAASLLSLYYQTRLVFYFLLFSLVPLTAFLKLCMERLAVLPMSRHRFFREVLLVLAIGPLFSVFIPSLVKNGTVTNSLLLFPANLSKGLRTPPPTIFRELNDPVAFGQKPLLIMNTMDEGIPILFYTQHKAFAAPYHMNVKGNLTAISFFSEKQETKARQILKDSGADLILMSKDTYASFNHPFERPDIDKMSQKEQFSMLTSKQSMGDRLAKGQTPDWLEPVWIMFSGDYLLFKVKKDRL